MPVTAGYWVVLTVIVNVPANDEAVGVMVNVALTDVAFNVTDEGEKVAPAGRPVTVSVTVELPLPVVLIVSGKVTAVVVP